MFQCHKHQLLLLRATKQSSGKVADTGITLRPKFLFTKSNLSLASELEVMSGSHTSVEVTSGKTQLLGKWTGRIGSSLHRRLAAHFLNLNKSRFKAQSWVILYLYSNETL